MGYWIVQRLDDGTRPPEGQEFLGISGVPSLARALRTVASGAVVSTRPSRLGNEEGSMAEPPSVSRAVRASARPLPQAAGATHYWNGSTDGWGDVAPQALSAGVRQPSFQAKGLPVTAHGASPYWTTGYIDRVPARPRQAIAWEHEAALMTFSLAPDLLEAPVHCTDIVPA